MSAEVRRATRSDLGLIAEFIVAAYGDLAKYKDPPHWHWQFESNPFRCNESELLPVSIAVENGRIVGQIAVQQAKFQCESQSVSGGWIVDVFILPSHRGQGLGHRLHKALAADFPLLLTLTMADATRRIAAAAGAISLNHVQRLTKLFFVRSDDVKDYIITRLQNRPSGQKIARKIFDVTGIQSLVALCLNAFQVARSAPTSIVSHPILIVEVSCFGPEIDELWQRCQCQYEMIVPRNREFLNWRFIESPHLAYRLFVARRGEICLGYSVLRNATAEELRSGIIVDLFAGKNDIPTISRLIDHAEEVFRGKVAAIECASSDPAVVSVLRSRGYFSTRTEMPTAVCNTPELRRLVGRSSQSWYFTKADHDWDQVHLAVR